MVRLETLNDMHPICWQRRQVIVRLRVVDRDTTIGRQGYGTGIQCGFQSGQGHVDRTKRALFLFHRALQRVLVAARKVHHLADFGFRNFKGKHTNDCNTLLVNGEHDLERLRMIQPEKAL